MKHFKSFTKNNRISNVKESYIPSEAKLYWNQSSGKEFLETRKIGEMVLIFLFILLWKREKRKRGSANIDFKLWRIFKTVLNKEIIRFSGFNEGKNNMKALKYSCNLVEGYLGWTKSTTDFQDWFKYRKLNILVNTFNTRK
jgi:hypothetical protein